jgi:hypothetical protein
MLYQEIVALCSEIRIKQSNALCGQLFSVKPGATVTLRLQWVEKIFVVKFLYNELAI